MTNPLISIIIPVYNVEQYIARCLQSCISQTFSDIEIVVVDDKGSDNSMDIARTFAQNDKRIKIVENPKNLGLFYTRRVGEKNANGLYIMSVDSDDFIEPNTCEVVANAIKKSNADIVHFGMSHYPKGQLKTSPQVKKGYLNNKQIQNFFVLGNNLQSMCNKAIKREIIFKSAEILSFIERPLQMIEDGLFLLAVSFNAKTYYGIKDDLYKYYNNPKSITRDFSKSNLKSKIDNFDYIFDLLQILKINHPNHSEIIEAYRRKLISAMIASNKASPREVYLQALQVACKHGYEKQCISQYLESCILSMRYAYRWQNLVCVFSYIFSFGKIRIGGGATALDDIQIYRIYEFGFCKSTPLAQTSPHFSNFADFERNSFSRSAA